MMDPCIAGHHDFGGGLSCARCDSDRIDDVFHGLDHLRILAGEVCSSCWSSDGEIVVATVEQSDPWGHVYGRLCERCTDREPGDVGEDDGPLTMAQQADVDARDGWRMR